MSHYDRSKCTNIKVFNHIWCDFVRMRTCLTDTSRANLNLLRNLAITPNWTINTTSVRKAYQTFTMSGFYFWYNLTIYFSVLLLFFSRRPLFLLFLLFFFIFYFRVCIKPSLMWNALIFRWFWTIGRGMPTAWTPNSMNLLWMVCEWSKILIRKYSLFRWCYLCKRTTQYSNSWLNENDENQADGTVYLCSIRTYIHSR